MTLERKLPKDTNTLLSADNNNIDNFNLKLNKAALFDGDKFQFFKTDKGKVIFNVQPDYSKIGIEAIVKRYKDNISKLGIEIKSIMLQPDWRMIVGIGNESVYETSMTLHHIYGIPYIPGSAIKGVVRSNIITEEFGEDESGNLDLKHAENRALQDRGFCDIFGCPKESFYKESRQGNVIFFDAFPLEPPNIEPDVMNVHYPDYYGGKKPPADYQNPKPIFFLTVKKTPFQFIIGIKEKNNIIIQNGEFKGKYPLDIAYENMQKALSEHGIGAKTAVGYGYMGEVSEKYRSEHMTENEKEEEKRKKEIENENKKRRKLIENLQNIDSEQYKYFAIDETIKYFKDHLSDSEYKKSLFDVLFDYKKVALLKKRYPDIGIANYSYELYKFIKENNLKIEIDIDLLTNKVSKIVQKNRGRRLKIKWKKYLESKN